MKKHQYYILSLEANDIYELSNFDCGGKKKTHEIMDIGLITSKDKVSKYFSSTIDTNLDILKLLESPKREEDTIRKISETNKTILLAFANVSFRYSYKIYKKYVLNHNATRNKKDVSTKSEEEKEKEKSTIYYKSWYRDSIKKIRENLDDSIYVLDGEIIAIEVNRLVKNGDKLPKQDYFYYDEKKRVYVAKSKIKKPVLSPLELRKKFYCDGFKVKIDGEEIKYRRYKRSANQAKQGICTFINEKYLDIMDDWSFIDNEFQTDEVVNSMKVEREAYNALSWSSLIDTVKIKSENILILKDQTTDINEKCVAVGIKDGNLTAEEKTVIIKNNIFDGEALLDKSVFDDNGYSQKGMMVLRNRYFKCCAFNTNLQKFFKDKSIESLNDLNGYTKAKKIEDIKLVVTYSDIKLMKFADYKLNLVKDRNQTDEEILEYWLENLGNMFGVVKTEKPSFYFDGKAVRTNYQMLNTIGLSAEETKNLLKPMTDFVNQMKEDATVFKYYLSGNETKEKQTPEETGNMTEESESSQGTSTFNYKISSCFMLMNLNDEFSDTSLYSDFLSDLIEGIRKRIKEGRVLVRGTYATIFGNGYEFLLSTIRKSKRSDNDIPIKPGEAMTIMFEDGVELCCCRSPHITMGNLYLVKNKISDVYQTYFNLTKEIVCVNAIGENINQRLNGMDYDSDTMLITDNSILVNGTKRHYGDFLVPVNVASPEEALAKPKELWEIDDRISNNITGEITDLSQKLNSILWDKYNRDSKKKIDKKLYLDICKLAVLSNMEIDGAKRNYGINSKKINDEIKKEYEDFKRPLFFKIRDDDKRSRYKESDYENFATTMDIIVQLQNTAGRGKRRKRFSEIMNKIPLSNTKVYGKKADEAYDIISDASNQIAKINHFNAKKESNESNKNKIAELLDEVYCKVSNQKLLDNASAIKILIEKIECEKTTALLWILLYIIVISDRDSKCKGAFYKLFKTDKPVEKLVMDENGKIEILGFKFKKLQAK